MGDTFVPDLLDKVNNRGRPGRNCGVDTGWGVPAQDAINFRFYGISLQGI